MKRLRRDLDFLTSAGLLVAAAITGVTGVDRRPVGPQRLLVPHGRGLRDGRVRDPARGPQLVEPRRLRHGSAFRGVPLDRRSATPPPERPAIAPGPARRRRLGVAARPRPSLGRLPARPARYRHRRRGRPAARPRTPAAAPDPRGLGRRRHLPPVEQARDHRRARHGRELGRSAAALQGVPGRAGRRAPDPGPHRPRDCRPSRRSPGGARPATTRAGRLPWPSCRGCCSSAAASPPTSGARSTAPPRHRAPSTRSSSTRSSTTSPGSSAASTTTASSATSCASSTPATGGRGSWSRGSARSSSARRTSSCS